MAGRPEQVEVAAYYVVSEALANATKHAEASVVHVGLRADDSMVSLAIPTLQRRRVICFAKTT